jgi:uncharacterized membrane protein YczE
MWWRIKLMLIGANRRFSMKKIIIYLLLWLIAAVFLMVWQYFVELPTWYLEKLLLEQCTFIGIIGGVMYCLRAVYLHRAALKDWNKKWDVWYYLRPVTSAISGFASYIFLKAGLLVLNASSATDQTSLGYLAIAFIAGYNVDSFMKKLEEVASSVWGIKESGITQELEKLKGSSEKEGKE